MSGLNVFYFFNNHFIYTRMILLIIGTFFRCFFLNFVSFFSEQKNTGEGCFCNYESKYLSMENAKYNDTVFAPFIVNVVIQVLQDGLLAKR